VPQMAHKSRQARSAERLATLVALAAAGLFAMLGARVVPTALFDADEMRGASSLLAPLLLTAALILLAWRRAAEARALHEELEAGRARELRLAYVDETTGLHNRRYLMKEIFSRVRGEPIVFLLLDLDGFKQVNDLHGHEAGDVMLKGVADRMVQLAPSTAEAIRLGGDEFAICLRGSPAPRRAWASRLDCRPVETAANSR
jgi:GGDEF domain-containing protein